MGSVTILEGFFVCEQGQKMLSGQKSLKLSSQHKIYHLSPDLMKDFVKDICS